MTCLILNSRQYFLNKLWLVMDFLVFLPCMEHFCSFCRNDFFGTRNSCWCSMMSSVVKLIMNGCFLDLHNWFISVIWPVNSNEISASFSVNWLIKARLVCFFKIDIKLNWVFNQWFYCYIFGWRYCLTKY